MMFKGGVLTISLDFELYWGVRDKKAIQQYKGNLQGVKNAIEQMLIVFHRYGIHATWSTVGFLFFQDIYDLKLNLPDKRPNYVDTSLSPYPYIDDSHFLDPQYHFAPELIDLIGCYKGQEIGTHTFSHYYCLEKGQTLDSFRADISSAVQAGKRENIKVTSIVFPRNQYNSNYLSILSDFGIVCYRGNENSWLYRAMDNENQTYARRILRLVDTYINISGHHVHDIQPVPGQSIVNIPSSRFLRPYSQKLFIFDYFRLRRITSSMTIAAKTNRVFHLWWHPHNFGANMGKNIDFLTKILEHYSKLKDMYGMHALNMSEIAFTVGNYGNK